MKPVIDDMSDDVEVLIEDFADITYLCDCGGEYGDTSLLVADGVFCAPICAYKYS